MIALPEQHRPKSDDPDFWAVWSDKSRDGEAIERGVNWKASLERNLLQASGGQWGDSHGWNHPKNGKGLGDAPDQPQQVVQLRQDAREGGARTGGQWWGGRTITTFSPSAEIDEQIRALSIQLNDCPLGSLEAIAISDQLNVLQGVKQSQYGAPSPGKKFKPK
jgi:hypothetical protein